MLYLQVMKADALVDVPDTAYRSDGRNEAKESN